MKKPRTPENIFEEEPTRSILNLLIAYKDVGLRPMYIRYALENDHTKQEEKKENGESGRNISRMQEFFGHKLENLEKTSLIKRDCIKSREHLNYYLRLLGEKNLGVIEKKGEYKGVVYLIKDESYIEGRKHHDKVILDYYSSNDIYEHESLLSIHHRPHEAAVHNIEPILRVYGMSPEVMKHAKKVGMKDNLFSTLEKIEEISLALSEMKDEIGRQYKNILFRKKCNRIDDQKIKSFIQTNPGLFQMILNEMDGFYSKCKTEKNGKTSMNVDKKALMLELHRKNELTSDQIKKLVDTITEVADECREIYSKDVYPSIFIDQLPSRARTGDLFNYFKIVGKLELPHYLKGTFVPMQKKDIEKIKKKP